MRPPAHRRTLLVLATLWTSMVSASSTAQVAPEKLQIGVLSLFQPTTLTVLPVAGDVLTIQACGQSLWLDASDRVTVRLFKGRLWLEDYRASTVCDELTATGRGSGSFLLEVPGELRRRYRGVLRLSVGRAQPARMQPRQMPPPGQEKTIVAVVTMDLQTAVASAVEAESPPNAPLAALEAQAIVARSFYLSGRHRHQDFDFCDTTHCQFLREPPSTNSVASIAAVDTRSLVLTYRGAVVEAYYSARCGGRTRTLPEAERGADGYPYFAVDCAWCLHHGTASRTIRAGFNQRSCALSRYGTASSHKLGLCQEGAADMARSGASATEILAHYYPNTVIAASRR